jgi:hypothetical protein
VRKRLLNRAPVGAHAFEQQVALFGCRHVGDHRFLVRLDERLVNVAQDIADAEAPLTLVDLGDSLDRLHPARRIRRHIHGLLVIVFDTLDRFVERTVQGRVIAEVLSYRVIDAVELALDDAFLGLTSGGEQYVTIPRSEILLRA